MDEPVDSVDKVLKAKSAEIDMWKKTHIDATTASAAVIDKLKSDVTAAQAAFDKQIANITAERDTFKGQLDAIAARVAKETVAS